MKARADTLPSEGGKEQRVLHIDLAGSRLGPVFIAVENTGDWPDNWPDERLRREAADYYGVPAVQVIVHRVAAGTEQCWDCNRIVCCCEQDALIVKAEESRSPAPIHTRTGTEEQ